VRDVATSFLVGLAVVTAFAGLAVAIWWWAQWTYSVAPSGPAGFLLFLLPPLFVAVFIASLVSTRRNK
jgi:hypothetical protein